MPYIHVFGADLAYLQVQERELVSNLKSSHLGIVIPFTSCSQPEDRLPEPVGSSMNRRFNMAASSLHVPCLFVTILIDLLIMFQAMPAVHHHQHNADSRHCCGVPSWINERNLHEAKMKIYLGRRPV
jgi:hypothetical protein